MAQYPKQDAAPQVVTGYPTNPPPPPPPPPPPFGVQSQVPTEWSTGLCDCCDDVGNCCLTFWCPCVTFGRIAEIVDRGAGSCGASGALYCLISAVTGCSCCYSCTYRSKLRKLYGLPESPCNDCLVHCCCETCAICQAYRELQNHGFDMSLGWHANMERMQRGGMFQPPAVQGDMMR